MAQPKGREPGVYFISMAEYHSDPAIGSSGIKNLITSPELYWTNSSLNPDREEFDTVATKSGRAYHLMVLEPEEPFPFAIKKGVKSSKVPDTIGEGDYEDLLKMYRRLLAKPKHWNALHGGKSEVSIFWRDEESGLICKIRPDNFAPEWVGDLKTISDIHKAIRYDFVDYGYHISGAMYSEGMQNLKKMILEGYKMPPEFDNEFIEKFMARDKQMFCFVFQGKKSPYTTRLWNMTPWASEIGHDKFHKGLAIYHENQHNLAVWPSGYADVEDIDESMVSQSINYI